MSIYATTYAQILLKILFLYFKFKIYKLLIKKKYIIFVLDYFEA